MPPLHSTLLTFRGHLQFSSKPLDYSSSKKGTVYIIRHSCLHHIRTASSALTHRLCLACRSVLCPTSKVIVSHLLSYLQSHAPHLASDTLPECQLSSISPPDALALPLLGALWFPLPVPRPAPDPDAPVISMPSICSDSSCFSSICTSSPAQTCIVGCHTITTLSSDVLTAVQCSPTPGAQQKSEGRAV